MNSVEYSVSTDFMIKMLAKGGSKCVDAIMGAEIDIVMTRS